MEKPFILEQNNSKNEEEDIGNKLEDFEILQTLGKGSYGFVAKVKSKKNEKIYAMKMIDFALIQDETEKNLSLNEIKIIKSLDSPHIIKYYNDFFVGEKYYIIMEYINNGDIKGYITAHQNMGAPIPEDELWDLFYQCMSGIICIHKNKLIHRDIKPANLFLTDDKTIKIGDFGVSATRNVNKNVNETKVEKETMMVGTPLYMSPEMFNHEKYGSKVDIYSLGCTFFEMCYFTPPRIPVPLMTPNFEITTDLQEIPVKFNKNFYSPDVTKLLELMIQKDPKKRGRDDDVFDIIRQKYYSKNYINSSINAVYRCLLSNYDFISFLGKHEKEFNPKDKPISFSFSIAYKELYNNMNWNNQLKNLRTILTYNNTSFVDPGEIEPEDLIEYILKTIHIENNKNNYHYSRIYSMENDPDIFNRQKILVKYLTNFQSILKSRISDLFFGTLETISLCTNCNTNKYFFESFYYLIIDINEALKNNLNLNNQNFISSCFQHQVSSKFKKNRKCLNCNNNTTNNLDKKNYLLLPKHLIICFRNETQQFGAENNLYPLNLDLSYLNQENSKAKYMLIGVIKKSIVSPKKKKFTCIYCLQNQLFVNDGINHQQINNIYQDNSGKVVVVFYSQIQ